MTSHRRGKPLFPATIGSQHQKTAISGHVYNDTPLKPASTNFLRPNPTSMVENP
jgi:hypothetical protein